MTGAGARTTPAGRQQGAPPSLTRGTSSRSLRRRRTRRRRRSTTAASRTTRSRSSGRRWRRCRVRSRSSNLR
eukprot:jgi/Mesen1/7756/ME000408S06870